MNFVLGAILKRRVKKQSTSHFYYIASLKSEVLISVSNIRIKFCFVSFSTLGTCTLKLLVILISGINFYLVFVIPH